MGAVFLPILTSMSFIQRTRRVHRDRLDEGFPLNFTVPVLSVHLLQLPDGMYMKWLLHLGPVVLNMSSRESRCFLQSIVYNSILITCQICEASGKIVCLAMHLSVSELY